MGSAEKKRHEERKRERERERERDEQNIVVDVVHRDLDNGDASVKVNDRSKESEGSKTKLEAISPELLLVPEEEEVEDRKGVLPRLCL